MRGIEAGLTVGELGKRPIKLCAYSLDNHRTIKVVVPLIVLAST